MPPDIGGGFSFGGFFFVTRPGGKVGDAVDGVVTVGVGGGVFCVPEEVVVGDRPAGEGALFDGQGGVSR